MGTNIKIICVGDAHVDDLQDLTRFKALGNFIVDEQPDQVIFMGDFVSMNCLSDWDKNKLRKMEGRRYDSEIQAGNLALDMALQPWEKQIKRASRKSVTKGIEWVFLFGNHENRADRYVDTNPILEHKLNLVEDLGLRERGFKVINYGSNHNVDGVSFTHIPIGANGRPISNPNVCQKAIRLYHNSVVFGHCHTLDHTAEYRHNAEHLNQALCVGGFFEHVDDYAIMSKNDYWRGIVVLDIYSTNRFDFETMALSKLKSKYA